MAFPRPHEAALVTDWARGGLSSEMPIKALLLSQKLGLVYRILIFACQSPFLLRSQLSPSILSHHAGSMGLERS